MSDQMVVSVGPYMFQSDALLFSNWFANSHASASPPHRILILESPCHPASSSIRQVAGVACIMVTPEATSFSASCRPSEETSGLVISTEAPTVSGNRSSSPAISKDNVVTASSRSWLAILGLLAIEVRKLTTAQCGIWTPFGLPVDPDV